MLHIYFITFELNVVLTFVVDMFLMKAEGIFRINGENGQEEYIRKQLNKGCVPHAVDVHCLAGLIKVFCYFISVKVSCIGSMVHWWS